MKKASLFLMVVACLVLVATPAIASTFQTFYTDWQFSVGLLGLFGDHNYYDYASRVDFYSGGQPDG
ncbi:MAG: hypothetical protein MUO85_05320, partial [candidate division Zixibacteria bacterium]|nr:hypothetical protein [candidate division Zixibacteria bacterium]